TTPGARDAEEHQRGTIQPQHILIFETTDISSDFGSGYRCDLVHHQPRRYPQPVHFTWLDGETEKRCVRRIGREGTDSDRRGRIEAVILQNHDRPRLAGVILAASKRPYLAALHSVSKTETESTNPWSPRAFALRATAKDWRWASAWKAGERTSGTQTWIGRKPCRRRRSRCAFTLS